MKILSKFENYKIPKEKLKQIQGAEPGGCESVCGDTCLHYYIDYYDNTGIDDLDGYADCVGGCEEACKPKAILG